MPLNQKKIYSVIQKAADKTRERSPGYKDKIGKAVAEIIQLEIQHNIVGLNIQQEINRVLSETAENCVIEE